MGTATRPDCTDLHVVTVPPEKVLHLQSRDPRICTSSVSGNKRGPITPPPYMGVHCSLNMTLDYDDPLRTSGSSDEESPPPQKLLDMRELFRRKSGDKRLLSDSCPRERLHSTAKRF